MVAKFRLTLVSVSVTHWALSFLIWNNGAFSFPEVRASTFFMTFMGHMGEFPKLGIFRGGCQGGGGGGGQRKHHLL